MTAPCPACASAAPAAALAADAAGEALYLSLPGIHCAGCIAGVERTLAAVPGLRAARFNLGHRRVRIRVERGADFALTDVVALSECIRRAHSTLRARGSTASRLRSPCRSLRPAWRSHRSNRSRGPLRQRTPIMHPGIWPGLARSRRRVCSGSGTAPPSLSDANGSVSSGPPRRAPVRSTPDGVPRAADPRAVLDALATARSALRRIRQDLAIAAGYDSIAIPVAPAGHPSSLAAIAMSTSSITAVADALPR